jgi:hypothetical protein
MRGAQPMGGARQAGSGFRFSKTGFSVFLGEMPPLAVLIPEKNRKTGF